MKALLPAAALLLTAVFCQDVRKCCPPGAGLADNGIGCSPSGHVWLYGNLSHGLPECPRPHRVAALLGTRVACLDSLRNGSFAAIVCPDEEDNDVTVPAVNLIGKCCPLGTAYHPDFRNCREHDSDQRRTLQRFLNVMVSGYSGIVDIDVGFPDCSESQVLVDYRIPYTNLWRLESESVGLAVPGEPGRALFNPEEVCVDATEESDLLAVRVCQDAYLTCNLKGVTCLRKCCREGYHLVGKKCEVSNRGLDPVTVYEIGGPSSMTPLPSRTAALRHGDICTNGKYILNPDNGREEESYFDVGGRLYLPYGDLFTDQYCFENVFRENASLNGTYVFVCFPDDDQAGVTKFTLWIPVALLISCFFLLVTFVVYACLPSLHNLHGKTLMCYVASLLFGYLCLATMQLDTPLISSTFLSCAIIGSAAQYTVLAAFCWLNVISFDIWWTFGGNRLNAHIGRQQRDNRRFLYYSLYGWGAPTVLTGLTILTDYTRARPRHENTASYTPENCWFSALSLRHVVFFFLPQIVTVASNVVFYVLTAVNCTRVKNELNRFKHTAKEERRFRADVSKMAMNVKLFIVMGISWVMDILSMFLMPESWGWILADGANCLQGVLIFCIFVLKKKVVKALKRRVGEVGRLGRHHRPSTSTLFTVISADSRINNQVLTKSASDSKLNIVIKKNNLNVSISDFNRHNR